MPLAADALPRLHSQAKPDLLSTTVALHFPEFRKILSLSKIFKIHSCYYAYYSLVFSIAE